MVKESHIWNRKSNCRRPYEDHLAGNKAEFDVTLDEASFHIQKCNGKWRICYANERSEVDKFVSEVGESVRHEIMIVGASSGKQTLPLIFCLQK